MAVASRDAASLELLSCNDLPQVLFKSQAIWQCQHMLWRKQFASIIGSL